MFRKVKARVPRRKPKNAMRYQSLSEGPSPEERLRRFLKQAEASGVRALTDEDFEQFMAEPGVWPDDETIDDFLAWRRQTRQEAR